MTDSFLIRPTIDYACPAWFYFASDISINKQETVQMQHFEWLLGALKMSSIDYLTRKQITQCEKSS